MRLPQQKINFSSGSHFRSSQLDLSADAVPLWQFRKCEGYSITSVASVCGAKPPTSLASAAIRSGQRSIVLRAPESAQGERSSKFIGLPLTVFCEGFVIAMQRPREN